MKPVDYFSRDVHTFWATTFQFELKLFDQFLLRRLGSAPLNSVVMCDEGDLTDTLRQLTEVDRYVAANANRRYVLRGMRVPSGGRFHPKTYLFASRRRTVLLVGSGNLTRSGLDRGSETFAEFDASIESDLPVFRAWASWMRQLIEARNDDILRRRYDHLRATLPVLVGPAQQDVFFTNGTRPFTDVIDELAPTDVTELHVSAPYFDEQAQALRGLIERVAPSEAVHVYLGARPSVDGQALAAMLTQTGIRAVVYRFDPDRFVHAKLIGLVGPDASLLVCGSANLSHAALNRVYEEPGSWGNCEAIVLRRGTGPEVRTAFCPPGSTVVEVALGEVAAFTYSAEDDAVETTSLRILSAATDADDRIVLRTDGAVDDGLRLRFEDDTDPLALEARSDGAATDPIPDGIEPLVLWIVDGAGATVSNTIVLDDPHALDEVLGERAAERDRPDELADEDERADLVALLSWAHRQFIFDLDDTPAIKRTRQSTEAEGVDSDAFWERYAREELTYDPRSQTYRPLVHGGMAAGTDLLLREIEAMLRAAPQERRLRLLRGGAADADEEPGTGHQWSLTARQQLRARNLIRRWARALPDPRHAWLAPEAPARNYEALIEVLALIWLGGALDEDDIVELLGEVWTGLLGSEARKGLADRADPALRDVVLGDVGADIRELAAGIAYCALAPVGWLTFIYEWQPFLVRGIEQGLFVGGELACAFAAAVGDEDVTAQQIEDLLLQRAGYVDDETWGRRTAAEMGFTSVRLIRNAGYRNVDLVVAVDGMHDPARDPKTIALARRVMALKKSDHVLVQAGDERYLLRLGALARARIGDQTQALGEHPYDRRRWRVALGGAVLPGQ
ncbi:MAG: hypothetical protein WKF51_12230, partial [Geodermatophilaceae bacterium]